MKKYHYCCVIVLSVFICFTCSNCKKNKTDSNTVKIDSPKKAAPDPVDSITGTYYGDLEDYKIIGPGSGGSSYHDTTDTVYRDSIVIVKVSTDSFKMSCDFIWYSASEWAHRPIRYDPANNYIPSFGAANVVFSTSNDSIRVFIYDSYYGSSGSKNEHITFLGKK